MNSSIITLKAACNLATKFMSLYMRNAVAYMLTGSYATCNANETSDLDVLVINRYSRSILIESYKFEGKKIQIIALPLLDIDYILYKDITIRKGVYLHQLTTGIILADENNILKQLQEKSKRIYKIGPHKLSDYEIYQLRGKITTRLEDLIGNKDRDEIYYIALELFQFLIDAYFKINQKWLFTGKYVGKVLKHEASDFHNLLINSYNAITNNDPAPLIKITEILLASIGGKLHFMSSLPYASYAFGEYLTIFIPTTNSFINRHFAETISSQFITSFNISAPQCNWLKLNWYHSIYKESGIFLICKASNQDINENLLPKIDIFVKSLDKTSLAYQSNCMEYPYQLSPLDGIKFEKFKSLTFELLIYLQNINSNKILYNTIYSLINHIWEILKISFQEEEALSIWKDVIILISNNEKNCNFIFDSKNKIAILNNEEAQLHHNFILPTNVKSYVEQLILEYIKNENDLFLPVLESTTQLIYKIFQLMEATLPNVNFHNYLIKVANPYD